MIAERTPSAAGLGAPEAAAARHHPTALAAMKALPSVAGPFERHLREAIALNRARAPRYAALSGGASRAVSHRLLRAEWLLLPLARWFDRRAEPYHRAGVPLLEALFVPMDRVPVFTAGGVPGQPEGARRPVAVARLRRHVRRAYRTDGFTGASRVLEAALGGLREAPHLDCMVRHLLESALRLSNLAPVHAEAARRRGLASPRWLSAWLLRMHLWGLGAAARLDRRAAPLQRRGIPILAQDVPPIAAWPEADPQADPQADP